MDKEEGKNCTNGVLTTGGFVEVNIDTFELKIRIAAISAGRVDTVLVAYHLYREKKGTEGHENPSPFYRKPFDCSRQQEQVVPPKTWRRSGCRTGHPGCGRSRWTMKRKVGVSSSLRSKVAKFGTNGKNSEVMGPAGKAVFMSTERNMGRR